MTVIVSGSRRLTRISDTLDAIRLSGFTPTLLLTGSNTGPEDIARWWAEHIEGIPVKLYPTDIRTYGSAAYLLTNREMAEHADALVAIWDGHSKPTAHLIDECAKRRLPTYIHRIVPMGERI